jgi:voltage-gated potassium channel
MTFVNRAVAVVILVSATLWLQCGGMAILIHWARACIARGIKDLSAWRAAVLMSQFTIVMIVLHLLQILLWAGFYRWRCLPSWEPSFYFSAASYSTVGYGDVVLPQVWRALGPIESMTGVLMSGLSVSTLFAIAIRLVGTQSSSKARTHSASITVPKIDAEFPVRTPVVAPQALSIETTEH